MSQEKLAEAIGSSKAVIGHLENGKMRLSDKWAHKIAPVLRTRAGFLFDTDPNDLDTDVLEIWADVPDASRAEGRAILKAWKDAVKDRERK